MRKSVGPAVHFRKIDSELASARKMLATICYMARNESYGYEKIAEPEVLK